MLKRMSLDERFLAFLDSKNPNESYLWRDPRKCACGQFCMWLYGEPPLNIAIACEPYGEMSNKDHRAIWNCGLGSYNSIAQGDPSDDGRANPDNWTFGKLRERFLAAKSECPDTVAAIIRKGEP